MRAWSTEGVEPSHLAVFRSLAVALLLAANLTPSMAFAQDDSADGVPEEGEDADSGDALERPPTESGEEGTRRVAIIVLASSGVDPETADGLTELAIGAVATRGHVSIVGKEEFQAQLGQGEARSAECVTSTTCLGRVGVQLGVDELIAGTVARRGDRWVFNLNRIVIRTGELAGRIFREVSGDVGAVADAVQDAIPQLYERVSDPGSLLVSASVDGAEVVVDGVLIGIYRGEAVQLTDVAPGRHELVVSAAGYFDWTRVVNVAEGATMQIEATLESPTGETSTDEGGISPLLWIGLGVGVAAGGLAAYCGVASQASPEPGLNRRQAVDFVSARQTEATIANISIGVAAAGVATAVIGVFLSDFGGDEAPVAAGIAPLPDGASLAVVGRLP